MKTIISTAFLFLISSSFAQKEEDVHVENEIGKLEGTLLYPDKKNIPVALIIAGSGPTDRNGNQGFSLVTNSYKMLAEELAANGIATLRYDKQGVGESKDAMIAEENTVFQNMVDDAGLFVDFLAANERFNEVVIIGHSEGALIGKLLAQEKEISKLISLAGAGRPITEILVEQISAQSDNLAKETARLLDELNNKDTLNDVPQELQGLFRQSIIPYLRSWVNIDPVKELEKAETPTLVIQGKRDNQVQMIDAENLAKCDNAELLVIEEMNHVLKDAPEDRQGNMMTYVDKSLPLSSGLVDNMAQFILKN